MSLFQRQARLKRVIDGDTIEVDIDLGWDVWLHNERVRLADVNADEIRGRKKTPAGLRDKAFTEAWCKGFENLLTLDSKSYHRTEKYGRSLCTVYRVGDIESLNGALAEFIRSGRV